MASSASLQYLSLFIVVFWGRKYRAPLPLLPLKHPHTITLAGCLTVLMVKRWRYLLTPLGLLTF